MISEHEELMIKTERTSGVLFGKSKKTVIDLTQSTLALTASLAAAIAADPPKIKPIKKGSK